MRRIILIGSGVLVLVAMHVLVVGYATRSGNEPMDEWRVAELVLPPTEPPTPNSPFTPQEQTILRHLRRGRPDPHSAYEVALAKRRDREFDEAGGNSPDALPFYLRLLNWEPRIQWSQEWAVLRQVARITGDRSAFRKSVIERLAAKKIVVGREAMQLLVQIGTAEDVPAVVERFVTIEYDDRIEPRDHAYFAEGLKILAKFGGEAEIAALDKAKAEHLLANDTAFWVKAEACKTAIRERLAKEKVDKK